MIQINNQIRGSGKTTQVKLALYEDPYAIALVPTNSVRQHVYPLEIQDRVYTFEEFAKGKLADVVANKIFVDEGFQMDEASMAGFYYTLGRANCDVVVYGTTMEMDRKSQTHFNKY